jgi:hypothetical protein
MTEISRFRLRLGSSCGDGDDLACKLLECCTFRLNERSARERLLRVVDVGDSGPVEWRLRAVRSSQEGQDRPGVAGQQEDLHGT